ncbi:LytTR family transcriptional regulator DNA-binding domain-containing protein [Fusobacterium ulcerans]
MDIDEKLIILLKEMLDYEFINTKRESSSFEIFIIDIDTENITDKIKANYKKGIPVIVVLGKNNIKEMRTLFLSNYVADCILKHEIYEIEKSIEKLIYSKQKYTQFYLNDNQKKGIIDFSEVTYISYCRTTRRIQFHLTNKEVFTLKENFSIIEEKLETINSFYKIERGTIINTSLIRYIDYKEETIIFRDFSILYVSKIKLKKIEEDLNLTKNRLYL